MGRQGYAEKSTLLATATSCLIVIAVFVVAIRSNDRVADGVPMAEAQNRVEGVCPPFHLLDEDGNVIDPVTGQNVDSPYSPAQTCGKCHDYQKIIEGYHFTQGKGEPPSSDQAVRCQWATTPGNYGGTWCSPAPLYRYLSPKSNQNAATMDMTSFSFITAGCGACHPGGGAAEFDREGRRYDRWMKNSESSMSPGGDNNYDGDYYQARWSETGVLEADCLICHFPEYDMAARKTQINKLNFRWAATAGSGFARVTGAIASGQIPTVVYNESRFNVDGTIAPHLVREPRNEACLACHAKPGWKKRGANFRARTDVHLRAGLKCVDCHPAGRSAEDQRIRGKEIHQIGKGDDPGGHVRDDLDNSCRDCASCHTTGLLGAPIAVHRWLPPLHLDKIACQTCHIPERTVKAALFQAGDVFNPGARIPTKGKHLWTFYGPAMRYWNHYGDLGMMGYDDKPSDPYTPVLARYKGKIYPVNQVHSAWPGIQIEGENGLMQPRMADVYTMWATHQTDSTMYARLADVVDDNADGIIEVNRPDEIDALIASVTTMLADTGYPMERKKVVWVMNDRVYSSGTSYRTVAKHAWEASPYANVHKYSHDVYPARAALGANGCVDCHNLSSSVFFAKIVKYPFDDEAKPITMAQYDVLGLSRVWAGIGALRETYGKPILYGLLVALVCSFLVLAGEHIVARVGSDSHTRLLKSLPWLIVIALGLTILVGASKPNLGGYMLPSRLWLDSNHFLISLLVIMAGLSALTWNALWAGPGDRRYLFVLLNPNRFILIVGLVTAGVSGLLIMLQQSGIETMTRASYTVFDLSLILTLLGCVNILLREGFAMTTRAEVKTR